MSQSFDVAQARSRFPGLQVRVAGQPAVFLDGPAGSQVPQVVIDAMGDYLARCNANCGGAFATSIETDRVLSEAREAAADLLGAGDSREIVFGPNMTSLTFALAGSLARGWAPGDEIVVTRLDHDANVTPWVDAAVAAGVRVRHVDIVTDDCTLDLDDLSRALGQRTRLVAVGAASNLVGTVNPVGDIVARAHAVGALVFVDAVHSAPHRAIDVQAWDCDFLACSPYKFFGPHTGILWGRQELLRSLPVAKVRPASDEIPARWANGTQNHEGIAGTRAAIDYLADLGRAVEGDAGLARRQALRSAFTAIEAHERDLCRMLLDGLGAQDGVQVWGITDRARDGERTPTVAFTHARRSPRQIAEALAERGIFAWSGNNYALALTETLGLEPEGVVRVGLLHYNTRDEVERFLDLLARSVA